MLHQRGEAPAVALREHFVAFFERRIHRQEADQAESRAGSSGPARSLVDESDFEQSLAINKATARSGEARVADVAP